MKKQINPDGEAWREKFYDSQVELCQKESQWHDSEQLLRLLVIRLTSLEDTSDRVLTNNLQILHKSLVAGKDILPLRKLIEDVAARILLLEKTNEKLEQNSAPHSPSLDAQGNLQQLQLVCDVFLVLLDNINFPAQYAERIEQIKLIMIRPDAKGLQQRLLAGITALAEVLDDTFSITRNDKQMLAQYFQQLTSELHGLDEGLVASSAWQLQKQQAEDVINQMVVLEVVEMENSMASLVNVAEFKRNVQVALNTIRGHMRMYKQQERQRNQQARDVIDGLTRQIREMEQKCEELKKQILVKHQQTLSDPLTGIRNRLAYEEAIKEEIDRFNRYARPVCLLMMDLDNFKHVNDSYGHNTGDKLLRFVAGTMAKSIRSVDFLARYGGEEFIIILPELNLQDAKKMANKICKAIRAEKFKDARGIISMTISGGLAQLRQDDTAETILDRADNALYLAKEQGRDRCETE